MDFFPKRDLFPNLRTYFLGIGAQLDTKDIPASCSEVNPADFELSVNGRLDWYQFTWPSRLLFRQ
jgi:hypothetical protein